MRTILRLLTGALLSASLLAGVFVGTAASASAAPVQRPQTYAYTCAQFYPGMMGGVGMHHSYPYAPNGGYGPHGMNGMNGMMGYMWR